MLHDCAKVCKLASLLKLTILSARSAAMEAVESTSGAKRHATMFCESGVQCVDPLPIAGTRTRDMTVGVACEAVCTCLSFVLT